MTYTEQKPGTTLVERLREEVSTERREEILAKGWDTAVRSLYDEIKRTGEHGDYQRLIFESWIIDGKDELLSEAASVILSLQGERDEAIARATACEQQAVQWKGEAMAHKSSLHEAYQVLTGAKGEPANWNGARPFRQFKEADQQAFVEWLRAWVRMKFGKIITYQTAYGARMSFNAERSDMVRETLAATSIIRKGAP